MSRYIFASKPDITKLEMRGKARQQSFIQFLKMSWATIFFCSSLRMFQMINHYDLSASRFAKSDSEKFNYYERMKARGIV